MGLSAIVAMMFGRNPNFCFIAWNGRQGGRHSLGLISNLGQASCFTA
jgi:hypothetical protein